MSIMNRYSPELISSLTRDEVSLRSKLFARPLQSYMINATNSLSAYAKDVAWKGQSTSFNAFQPLEGSSVTKSRVTCVIPAYSLMPRMLIVGPTQVPEHVVVYTDFSPGNVINYQQVLTIYEP